MLHHGAAPSERVGCSRPAFSFGARLTIGKTFVSLLYLPECKSSDFAFLVVEYCHGVGPAQELREVWQWRSQHLLGPRPVVLGLPSMWVEEPPPRETERL